MGKTVEVRLPYTALLTQIRPDIPLLWKNDQYIKWAQMSGYDGVELHCLKPVAREVLQLPEEELKKKVGIKSGHVIFNPYVTLTSIIRREQDPLRPGEKLALYNLFLAENPQAIKTLHKLEKTFGLPFPITTYPYEINGKKPYGEYQFPLVQTHPAVFNNESTAEDFLKKGNYITWDIYHAFEATSSGNRPLADWRRNLIPLLEAKIIKEVHVQAGRIPHNDPTVPSIEWLQGMVGENPCYNNELGQIIRTVKESDPTIPFVMEISIDGLIKAGLLKQSSLLLGLNNVREIHQQLVDYVKRV